MAVNSNALDLSSPEATRTGEADPRPVSSLDDRRPVAKPIGDCRSVGTVAGVVYLMRGLPSCGKSRRAHELAGATGIVCETDEFFHTHVGDTREDYNYVSERQQEARDWNYERFIEAVDAGVSTIVVDRGNGLNLETQRYARYAHDRGYTILIAEPDSPWWLEIRVLLKYKEHTMPVLMKLADELAMKNRSTHRTPAKTIRRWMKNWKPDLTVEAILDYAERGE